MEEDILGRVVEVEKEIRRRLETEKEKSAKWLATAREDAEKEVERAREELDRSLDTAIKEAAEASENNALRMIEDAKLSAERLEGLEDDKLREIILRHISTILPGD